MFQFFQAFTSLSRLWLWLELALQDLSASTKSSLKVYLSARSMILLCGMGCGAAKAFKWRQWQKGGFGSVLRDLRRMQKVE